MPERRERERFEIYIVYKRRYINTLPFLFYRWSRRIRWEREPRCSAPWTRSDRTCWTSPRAFVWRSTRSAHRTPTTRRCSCGDRATANRRSSYLPYRRRSTLAGTWRPRATSSPSWDICCTAPRSTPPSSQPHHLADVISSFAILIFLLHFCFPVSLLFLDSFPEISVSIILWLPIRPRLFAVYVLY